MRASTGPFIRVCYVFVSVLVLLQLNNVAAQRATTAPLPRPIISTITGHPSSTSTSTLTPTSTLTAASTYIPNLESAAELEERRLQLPPGLLSATSTQTLSSSRSSTRSSSPSRSPTRTSSPSRSPTRSSTRSPSASYKRGSIVAITPMTGSAPTSKEVLDICGPSFDYTKYRAFYVGTGATMEVSSKSGDVSGALRAMSQTTNLAVSYSISLVSNDEDSKLYTFQWPAVTGAANFSTSPNSKGHTLIIPLHYSKLCLVPPKIMRISPVGNLLFDSEISFQLSERFSTSLTTHRVMLLKVPGDDMLDAGLMLRTCLSRPSADCSACTDVVLSNQWLPGSPITIRCYAPLASQSMFGFRFVLGYTIGDAVLLTAPYAYRCAQSSCATRLLAYATPSLEDVLVQMSPLIQTSASPIILRVSSDYPWPNVAAFTKRKIAIPSPQLTLPNGQKTLALRAWMAYVPASAGAAGSVHSPLNCIIQSNNTVRCSATQPSAGLVLLDDTFCGLTAIIEVGRMYNVTAESPSEFQKSDSIYGSSVPLCSCTRLVDIRPLNDITYGLDCSGSTLRLAGASALSQPLKWSPQSVIAGPITPLLARVNVDMLALMPANALSSKEPFDLRFTGMGLANVTTIFIQGVRCANVVVRDTEVVCQKMNMSALYLSVNNSLAKSGIDASHYVWPLVTVIAGPTKAPIMVVHAGLLKATMQPVLQAVVPSSMRWGRQVALLGYGLQADAATAYIDDVPCIKSTVISDTLTLCDVPPPKLESFTDLPVSVVSKRGSSTTEPLWATSTIVDGDALQQTQIKATFTYPAPLQITWQHNCLGPSHAYIFVPAEDFLILAPPVQVLSSTASQCWVDLLSSDGSTGITTTEGNYQAGDRRGYWKASYYGSEEPSAFSFGVTSHFMRTGQVKLSCNDKYGVAANVDADNMLFIASIALSSRVINTSWIDITATSAGSQQSNDASPPTFDTPLILVPRDTFSLQVELVAYTHVSGSCGTSLQDALQYLDSAVSPNSSSPLICRLGAVPHKPGDEQVQAVNIGDEDFYPGFPILMTVQQSTLVNSTMLLVVYTRMSVSISAIGLGDHFDVFSICQLPTSRQSAHHVGSFQISKPEIITQYSACNSSVCGFIAPPSTLRDVSWSVRFVGFMEPDANGVMPVGAPPIQCALSIASTTGIRQDIRDNNLLDTYVEADRVEYMFQGGLIDLQQMPWGISLSVSVSCVWIPTGNSFRGSINEIQITNPVLSVSVHRPYTGIYLSGSLLLQKFPDAAPALDANLTFHMNDQAGALIAEAGPPPLCVRFVYISSFTELARCENEAALAAEPTAASSWRKLSSEEGTVTSWTNGSSPSPSSQGIVYTYSFPEIPLSTVPFGSCYMEFVECSQRVGRAIQKSIRSKSKWMRIVQPSEGFRFNASGTFLINGGSSVPADDQVASANGIAALHGETLNAMFSNPFPLPPSVAATCEPNIDSADIALSIVTKTAFEGRALKLHFQARLATFEGFYARGFSTGKLFAVCTAWNQIFASESAEIAILQLESVLTVPGLRTAFPINFQNTRAAQPPQLQIHPPASVRVVPAVLSQSGAVVAGTSVLHLAGVQRLILSIAVRDINLEQVECRVEAEGTGFSIHPETVITGEGAQNTLNVSPYWLVAEPSTVRAGCRVRCRRLDGDDVKPANFPVQLLNAAASWIASPIASTVAFQIFPPFSLQLHILPTATDSNNHSTHVDPGWSSGSIAPLITCSASMHFLNATSESSNRFARVIESQASDMLQFHFKDFSATAPRLDHAAIHVECAIAANPLMVDLQSPVRFAGCPVGSQPTGPGWLCEVCPEGSYSDGGAKPCTACPVVGTTCSGGLLQLLEGFYRPPSLVGTNIAADTELYPCFNGESCIVNSTERTYACSTGYVGPLCGVCDQVKNYGLFGTYCRKCWPEWSGYFILSLITLAILAAAYWVATKRSGVSEVSSKGPPTGTAVRLLLTYLQSLSAITAFRAGGTRALREMFAFTDTVSDSPFSLGPIQCVLRLSITSKYLLTVTAPLILGVTCIVVFFGNSVLLNLYCCVQHRKRFALNAVQPQGQSAAGRLSQVASRQIFCGGIFASDITAIKNEVMDFIRGRRWASVITFVTFMCYMPIINQSIRALVCTTRPIDGKYYLESDYTVVCFQGEHTFLSIVAWTMLAFLGAGLPVMLFIILRNFARERKKAAKQIIQLSTGQITAEERFRVVVGFLFQGYDEKRGLMWWEAIALWRKAGIVVIRALISDAFYQLAAVIMLIGAGLLLHERVQPYKEQMFNRADSIAQLVTLLTAICSIVYLRTGMTLNPSTMEFDETALSQGNALPSQYRSQVVEYALTFFLFVANLSVAIMMVGVLIHVLKKKASTAIESQRLKRNVPRELLPTQRRMGNIYTRVEEAVSGAEIKQAPSGSFESIPASYSRSKFVLGATSNRQPSTDHHGALFSLATVRNLEVLQAPAAKSVPLISSLSQVAIADDNSEHRANPMHFGLASLRAPRAVSTFGPVSYAAAVNKKSPKSPTDSQIGMVDNIPRRTTNALLARRTSIVPPLGHGEDIDFKLGGAVFKENPLAARKQK